MGIAQLNTIKALLTRLDAANPARFSYREAAYVDDSIEGVENFNLDHDMNVPNADATDFDDGVLDIGLRTQGSSITRAAMNHFFGRLSYNLRKLTQQELALLSDQLVLMAHNTNEYDPNAKYLTGDQCFVVSNVNRIPGDSDSKVFTMTVYTRVSVSPAELSGHSPTEVGQVNWAEVQDTSAVYPQLAIDAPGYQHAFTAVDLSDTNVYTANTWYPLVSGNLRASTVMSPKNHNSLLNLFEAYVTGSVSGQSVSCRAELVAAIRTAGFDTPGYDVTVSPTSAAILSQSFISQVNGNDLGLSNSPIGLTLIAEDQQVVFWLRGGSKYGLWNSFGANFTIVTGSYYPPGGGPVVSPKTSRQFSFTPLKVWMKVGVPTPSANEDAAPKSFVDAETSRAQSAESALAPKYNAILTGNPTAPTQAAGDASTHIATTQYADSAVAVESLSRVMAVAGCFNKWTRTASSSFTVPAGVTELYITGSASGGRGGNGGHGSSYSSGGGGGGGGSGAGIIRYRLAVTAGDTIAVALVSGTWTISKNGSTIITLAVGQQGGTGGSEYSGGSLGNVGSNGERATGVSIAAGEAGSAGAIGGSAVGGNGGLGAPSMFGLGAQAGHGSYSNGESGSNAAAPGSGGGGGGGGGAQSSGAYGGNGGAGGPAFIALEY